MTIANRDGYVVSARLCAIKMAWQRLLFAWIQWVSFTPTSALRDDSLYTNLVGHPPCPKQKQLKYSVACKANKTFLYCLYPDSFPGWLCGCVTTLSNALLLTINSNAYGTQHQMRILWLVVTCCDSSVMIMKWVLVLRPETFLKVKEGIGLRQNMNSIKRGNGAAGMTRRLANVARTVWLSNRPTLKWTVRTNTALQLELSVLPALHKR